MTQVKKVKDACRV